MKVAIENDFQQKIMSQTFSEPTILASAKDVQAWRQAWMGALASWHSPYKVMIDCSQLTVVDDGEVRNALDLMLKFFNGFFLRKAVGFGMDPAKNHDLLPFPVVSSEEEAGAALGIRTAKTREPTDFRGAIQIQNHFQQHTIELSFSGPVTIATKEQLATLKSKLMNNLMQWHSKWSLLIDCANLEFTNENPELESDWRRLEQVLRGFFMKTIIGYAPRTAKEAYPFPVFRARHRAAAALEGEGNISADKADCKSRKVVPSA